MEHSFYEATIGAQWNVCGMDFIDCVDLFGNFRLINQSDDRRVVEYLKIEFN